MSVNQNGISIQPKLKSKFFLLNRAPDKGRAPCSQGLGQQGRFTGETSPPRRVHLLPAGGVRAGERVGARHAEHQPNGEENFQGFWGGS